MKIIKKILTLIAFSAIFTGCIVDDESSEITDTASSSTNKTSTTSSATVTKVNISGSSTISYDGTAVFTAIATTSGSPALTYTWSVSSGSDYASITGNGETATLKANNTSDSAQNVTVKVVVSDGTNSVNATASVTVSKNGETVKDEITAVSLTAANENISATGKTKLTASPVYTGSPSIIYVWEITSGGDYAYFTSEGEGSITKTTENDGDCKISGNNTSDSVQSVTVKVTATDSDGNSFSDEATITVNPKGSTSDSYNADSTVDTAAYSNVIYVDLEAALVSSDNADWQEITTSAVQPINSVKVKFTESDDDLSTGLIRINASSFSGALAVYLSGKMTGGGVKIQSNGSDIVAVYLNDAKITSSNYPCVEVTKGSNAIVNISGTNTFIDGRKYGTGYGAYYTTDSSLNGTAYDDEDNYVYCASGNVENEGSDSKGTLYSKGDLTISGSGTLSVTQAYKNCIATKANLTVNGGTYTLISTGKSGLYGDQGVTVNSGSITFTGTGAVSSSAYHKAHGINTDDETYANSEVNINGGSLNFTITYGKGITAPVVNIAGGTNVIKVTSPTSKVLSTSSSYYTADGEGMSETVSFAPQGIDGGTVNVSGGTTTITAPWSGINSDGNITISDGTVTITTSGNGVYDSSESDYTAPSCIKADGNVVVQGGTVTGTNSGNGGKGIKADGTYTQKAGSVNVKTTGSNLGSSGSSGGFGRTSSSSSASSSAKGVKVTGAITVSGGKLYATSSSHEAIESKSTITITDGEVYGYSSADDGINASSHLTISGGYVCGYSTSNDGLDSNGNTYIQGGVVFAVGSSSPEVAIDANTESNYKLYISGGTIMTLGPIESGASLTQSCYSASSWTANKTYALTVENTTYTFKTPSSTSGYGSGIVISSASTPTLTYGATAGSTTYFDGLVSAGGTKGSTSVSLSSYSSSSSGSSMGGNKPGWR